MGTRKKVEEIQEETLELAKDDITKAVPDQPAAVSDPVAAAVAAIKSLSATKELQPLSSGALVDPGRKVYQQSDIDHLQEQIDWLYRKNLFTIYSGAASHAITFEPGGVFLLFITWGSQCNFYFVNSGTSTAYSKTLVDQMSGDVTVTRDGLTYTYTSTAGNSLSAFVKRLN